jgi:hypothetical protein
MIIFTTLDKIKPNPENIRTLNVAAVKVNNRANDKAAFTATRSSVTYGTVRCTG